MHSLGIIIRLNKEAQDKFEGRTVQPVRPNIAKKTVSRARFFRALRSKVNK